MTDYNSTFTGAQVDSAVSAVREVTVPGGTVGATIPNWAALDASTSVASGQVYTLVVGELGIPEPVQIVAAGTYTAPDGVLVRNLTGSGLQAKSLRQTYASVSEFIADPRTHAAGTLHQIPTVGGTYLAVASGGNLGRTNAGGQAYTIQEAQGYVTPEMFGAAGNGTTDDTTVMGYAISSGLDIKLIGGYLLSGAVTFTQRVVATAGSYLTSASAVTVTFSDTFSGCLSHHFRGSITAAFNEGKQTPGYAEWWGAVVNDTGTDCQAAIDAAHAALPWLKLQAGKYYLASTNVTFGTNNRRVSGFGMGAGIFGTQGGTEIVSQSSTAHVVRVGLLTDPGSIGSFAQGLILEDFSTNRTVAVTPPTAGSEAGAPSGFIVDYVLDLTMNRLGAVDNSIGFNSANVIASKYVGCISARLTNGNSATNDIYWGFLANSTGTYGHQTVFYDRCASTANPVAQGSKYGFTSSGQITDVQIIQFEADAYDEGILLDGTGATKSSIDNVISGCILDQCISYGIRIQNQPAKSTFKITNCYALCKVGATAHYSVSGTGSQFTLLGNEAVGLTGTSAYGLQIDGATGVTSIGNMWNECANPVTTSGTNFIICDNILNQTQAVTTASIDVTAGAYGRIASVIGGAAGSPIGVNVASGVTSLEVNTSTINAGAVTNVLDYAGAKVTSLGTFGTSNLAVGTHI